jgi:hypothetical protein
VTFRLLSTQGHTCGSRRLRISECMARELVYRYAFMSPLTCSSGPETIGNLHHQPVCFFTTEGSKEGLVLMAVSKASSHFDPAP